MNREGRSVDLEHTDQESDDERAERERESQYARLAEEHVNDVVSGRLPPDDVVSNIAEDMKRAAHPLERIELKPRTTAKRFARDLKSRIERAAVAVDLPGQEGFASGMRYVLGIVDAALSDYDVRDPGDTP